VKHDEIYDKHADRKSKPPRRKFAENKDRDARLRRVSFKNYVRELEEDLLEVDLGTDDSKVV
jgi:hypothetical protein